MEDWKRIGIESKRKYYEVSSRGRVRSVWKESGGQRMMAVSIVKPSGRQRVTIDRRSLVNTKQEYYVHRLIGMAFIPNPDNLPEIDHIDGNPTNNHVSNLRWADKKDQAANRKISTTNTSGVKGVSFLPKYSRWRVSWVDDGVLKTNSTFTTMEAAVEFRQEIVKEVYPDTYIEDR
jgi:hypothetical protein